MTRRPLWPYLLLMGTIAALLLWALLIDRPALSDDITWPRVTRTYLTTQPHATYLTTGVVQPEDLDQ
jgi:hypothetical protein